MKRVGPYKDHWLEYVEEEDCRKWSVHLPDGSVRYAPFWHRPTDRSFQVWIDLGLPSRFMFDPTRMGSWYWPDRVLEKIGDAIDEHGLDPENHETIRLVLKMKA